MTEQCLARPLDTDEISPIVVLTDPILTTLVLERGRLKPRREHAIKLDTLISKQVSEWKEEKERLIDDLKPKFKDMANICKPYCTKLHFCKKDSDIPPPPTNLITRKYGLCNWTECEFCKESIDYYD